MHADDIRRPSGGIRDRIDVERRGIGREHGAGPADLAEPGEDFALDDEILEHGLDHEVRAARGGKSQRSLHTTARCRGRVAAEPTLALCGLDRGLHARKTRIERFLLRVDQRDRDAPGRKADGDPGAHRACAEHCGPAHRPREFRRAGRLALGKKQIPQCP